ncbi:hypothetical protein KIH27_04485 [Mycobacterium sp. M1]|uniref:Transmembrane protein n=2 Tax=Mycolicibacter acidiphilus TaxID=2835306 RepID=A0ABS5RF66_9MYCO|nr:hypothetical protein [Mycolicibacter acidiphilus]
MTEPHWPPSLDTGPHPTPLSDEVESTPEPQPVQEVAVEPEVPKRPRSSSAGSVTVRGHLQFLQWWQLPLVLAAVWIPAAGIGLGLFAWWYSLADKTPAVFVTLVYAVVCVVAGLILAMVGEKPLVAAVAIAVMSAVFASGVAAAPLYGHHYCHHASRCLAGILPY